MDRFTGKNEDEMKKNMKELLSSIGRARVRGQLDVPTTEHMSFIPTTQHSNVILMKSHKPTIENMTTLLIGSIRDNYTQDMWEQDVNQWEQVFVGHKFIPIQIMPNDALPDAIDSRDATKKIEKTLLEINALPPGEKIRIIILGTGQAGFLMEAITFLLRDWTEPNGQPRRNKYLHFITSGDTKDHDMSNFCHWLCISEVCETIEFYNTMYYHAFGYCARDYNGHR